MSGCGCGVGFFFLRDGETRTDDSLDNSKKGMMTRGCSSRAHGVHNENGCHRVHTRSSRETPSGGLTVAVPVRAADGRLG